MGLNDLSSDTPSIERIRDKYSDTHNIERVYRSPPGYKADIKCGYCGDVFSTTISRIRNGRSRFCSKDCMGKGKSLKIDTSDRDKMAYIGGVYVGDGCIYREGGKNTFRLQVVDKIFRNKVGEILSSIDINPRYYSRDNSDKNRRSTYSVVAGNVYICDYLEDRFSKESGIKNIFSLHNEEEMKQFVCGFYESEGTEVGVDVCMSQKNIDILFSIKAMLYKIGIRSSIYKSDEYANTLRIKGGIYARRKFFREIDPVIRNPLREGELNDPGESGLTRMVDNYA